MKRKLSTATALMALLVASGCESMGEKQGVGTLLGAVAGAAIGSQFGNSTSDRLLAAAAGAAIGGALGNWIGAQLDEADRRRHLAAVQESYRSGRLASWANPQNGTSGTVTAVQPLSARPGCYQASDTITVNGQARNAQNTYCTQPDGSFALAN